MILIADSGSTKTDWCLAEQGNSVFRFQSKGLNPYFVSDEEMEAEVQALIPRFTGHTPEAVYFYGAGCTFDKIGRVKQLLAHCLRVEHVEVASDALAAARSTCGYAAGISCILGTGSNACFYDGKEIAASVSPLGFILGDEGSGAVLGKLLVGDLFKGMMSEELKNDFLKTYNLTLGEVIDRVYRQPFPNRFLASFTPFIRQHLDSTPMHHLVLSSFKAFIRRNVMGLNRPSEKVNFVGSVAFFFQDVLKEAADECGIKLGTIVQSPMEGLLAYHNQ